MSGKWSRWGQKVEYGFPKTKVNIHSDCDPLNPDKCPKKNPVCVSNTILDADFENYLYQ